MGQLGNHIICSINKKQQVFKDPIRNPPFFSNNKKQQAFDWPIRKQQVFGWANYWKPHDLIDQ